MSDFELNLIALDIRKWDLELERLTIKLYYIINETEQTSQIDLSLTQLPEMVEELINKFRQEAETFLKNSLPAETEANIVLANDTFLRQKLSNYFKRVLLELNNPRRKKGQSRMIYSTHMDMYNENQDISFLPEKLRFNVVINWVRKYYDHEDYQKAIEPLRKLIQLRPDYGLGYKWLARSLKKVRKYEESMRMYEKYAEVDQSLDAYQDLAKSYRKGKLYDQSREIYQKILKDNPDDKEARIGMAQIQYAQNDDSYQKILNKLYAEDPEWVKNWLREEFNFRIYISPKTPLTPIQATRYLGFDQVFELTQRAFQNDIPSHFNPARARMSFYKEELDNWSRIYNQYQLGEEEVTLHPEAIDAAALRKTSGEGNGNGEEDQTLNPATKSSTKVEEILKEIREMKAIRKAAERYQSRNGPSRNSKNRKKSGRSNTGIKTKPEVKNKKNNSGSGKKTGNKINAPGNGDGSSKKSRRTNSKKKLEKIDS